jgi:hypothetical protein
MPNPHLVLSLSRNRELELARAAEQARVTRLARARRRSSRGRDKHVSAPRARSGAEARAC